MKLPAYRELSREQLEINDLPLDTSALVTGPPGTGKTVMALYRANIYREADRTAKVLMYNKALVDYVNTPMDADAEGPALPTGVDATTYHSFIAKLYWRFNHRYIPTVAGGGSFDHDWEHLISNLVPKLAGQKQQMPVLLIDEGQDLPAPFYSLLGLLVGTGQATVFADENQQIMAGSQATLEEIRTRTGYTAELELRRNYRNTREIAEAARCFFAGLPSGVPDLPERKGEQPAVIRTKNEEDVMSRIAARAETYPDEHIGVLLERKKDVDRFVRGLSDRSRRPVRWYHSSGDTTGLEFDKPGVRVLTHASAKGLEFDTVFLPNLQNVNWTTDGTRSRMLFYVLLSRARNTLFLTYTGQERPGFLDCLGDTVEWRDTP